MGFSWMSIATDKSTKAEKGHMNELVSRISTLETKLLLSSNEGYSWQSGYSPFTKVEIEMANLTKIREAVDNLYDNNYCRQHRSSHRVSHCGTHYPSELSTHLSGRLSTHNRSVDSGDYSYNNTNNNPD